MNKKRFIYILLVIFAIKLPLAATEPVKIAIIGDTEKHLAELDMLTVKLSGDDKIILLERSDWDYLLRERQISKSKIGQSSIKIGKLLGADGLIILTEEEIKGKKYLFTKLVAVNNGVILDSIVSPIKEQKEEFSLGESIEHRFKPKFAKLKAGNNGKITISMLNLRSASSAAEMLAIEKDLNAIFAQRLMREQNVLVNERWNIAEASLEKNLEGKDETGFKTGNVVIDGAVELNDKDTVEVKLTITTPDSKKQEFTVTGPKKDLGKIAEDLTTKCLEVAKVAKKTIDWDRKKEALEYYKEAQWAYNAGLFFKAAQSSESAWALGEKTPESTLLRIKCYTQAAYPLKDGGRHGVNYKKGLIDVTKTDKNLDAAILAIELYWHAFVNKKGKLSHRNSGLKPNPFSSFSTRVFNSLAMVLRTYYEQKSLDKDIEKQAFLRKMLRKAWDLLIKKNPRIAYNSVSDIKYICESNVETKERYLKMLTIPCNVKAGNCIRKNIVNSIAVRHGLLDRSSNYDKKQEHQLTDDFIDKMRESKDLNISSTGLISACYDAAGWYNWERQNKAERKRYLSKLFDFYKKNKAAFYNHEFIFPRQIVEQLAQNHPEFAYDYLHDVFSNYLKTKKNVGHYALLNDDICKNIKFTESQAKKLYSLLQQYADNKWHFGWQEQVLRKDLLNRFPQVQGKIYRIKPDWSFNPQKDFKGYKWLRKSLNSKDMVYLIGKRSFSNNFMVLAFNVKSRKFKVFKSGKVDRKLINSVISTETVYYNNNRITFISRHTLVLLNMTTDKWQYIKLPENSYHQTHLKGDQVLAAFYPFSSGKYFSTGLLKIDLDSGKQELLFSTRRKPAINALDNRKGFSYKFFHIDNDLLVINWQGVPSLTYILDKKTLKATLIEDWDIDQIKKYFTLYATPKANGLISICIFFHKPNMYFLTYPKPKTKLTEKVVKHLQATSSKNKIITDQMNRNKFKYTSIGKNLVLLEYGKIKGLNQKDGKEIKLPVKFELPNPLEKYQVIYLNDGILLIDNQSFIKATSAIYFFNLKNIDECISDYFNN